MPDKMIYAMSTRDSFSLDKFIEIFRMLYLPTNPDTEDWFYIDPRRYLVRLLDSLGFCEFDFNRRMVYMCPPSLVLLPVCGLPKAVLTGARSPRLLRNMKSLARKRSEEVLMESVPQKDTNVTLPPSIYIEAISIQVLRGIADELGIKTALENPASWLLANFSASINEVKESVVFEDRAEPGWKRRVFDESKLYFSYDAKGDAESLVFKEYTNPVNMQLKHWLWDGEKSAEVERDWGRYLALCSSGSNIILYDPVLSKMAVPATVPPPCILARSLVMCSGAAPRIAKTPSKRIGDIPPGSLLHVYQCVPPSIARLVSAKLGQKLISVRFKKNNMVA
jgi:hypothetical protein